MLSLRILFILVFAVTTARATQPTPDTLIKSMTLEEKIGQLLMVSFYGTEASEAQRLIGEAHIGGVIYYRFSNKLTSPEQVAHLSQGLQEQAQATRTGIPLLISADQEGGRVNRLTTGFTHFPPQVTVGNANNELLTQAWAKAVATELRAVGITMNMSPVADVNSNPKNPIIGDRAFGDKAEHVAQHVAATLDGYEGTGVVPVVKHFPGHGDVEVDSHKALPTVDKSFNKLLSHELVPFMVAALKKAPAIMTAHLLLPQIDAERCATLSPTIITGILRKGMNYDGVVITDSMMMQGVLVQQEDVAAGCIEAFNAGHDILLLGGKCLTEEGPKELSIDDVIGVHHALVAAVHSGKISEEQLDKSVKRILNLKATSGFKDIVANTTSTPQIPLEEHAHLIAQLQ